ncbi:MAG: metallophosphoesterase [Bacteroidales bacterium]
MKFQYASDLHLEFPENKAFLRKNPLKPEGDILLLAGDIVPIINMYEHIDFFDFVSDHFESTYWLPGNHEHYHSDIKDRFGYLNEKIRENVFLVNNTSIVIKDITLIFSTLWTRITARYQSEIHKTLSDFRVIRSGGRLLTVGQYNLIHDQCISFLKMELSKEKKSRNIVVTHHTPTFLNYPEEFRGDALNEAFAVELSELIETFQPDFWIFGHLHSNNNDFKIGKTRLVTNQLGYVMFNEQKGFNTGKIIEV